MPKKKSTIKLSEEEKRATDNAEEVTAIFNSPNFLDIAKEKEILDYTQIKMQNKIYKTAKDEGSRKVEENMRNPRVSYEESDQSPLKGEELRILKKQWASALDYTPFHVSGVMGPSHLSRWLRIIYTGDYKNLLDYLKNNSEEEIKRLLEKRETCYNVNAIFHAVIGARYVHGDHEKVLIKLISLGVDPNVRDMAGYTPLHHCVQYAGNEVTFKMAKRLLKAGAKVDARNRFGETPLLSAVCSIKEGDYKFIELLLEHGANQCLSDNEGVTAETFSYQNAILRRLFEKYNTALIKQAKKEARIEAGGSKPCFKCGKTNSQKRCTGCYMTSYCSAECQRSDWERHRSYCRETAKKFKDVTVDVIDSVIDASKSFLHGKVIGRQKNLPLKNHMTLKVQVPLCPDTNKSMMIYNKEKTVLGEINQVRDPILYQELLDKVNTEGFKGVKGFFQGIVVSTNSCKKTIHLRVNVNDMLQCEKW